MRAAAIALVLGAAITALWLPSSRERERHSATPAAIDSPETPNVDPSPPAARVELAPFAEDLVHETAVAVPADELSIVVLDRPTRAPVVDASILVREHGAQVSQRFSDASGSARLAELEWGRVSLEIGSRTHFGAWIEPRQVLDAITGGRRLEVELDRFGELEVRVVDGGGRPERGVFVDVLPADPQAPSRPRWVVGWPHIQRPGRVTVAGPVPGAMPGGTDRDGVARFPFLPCDRPMIVFVRLDVAGSSARVTIPSATARESIELRMPPQAELRGRLVGPSGDPAALVDVHCLDGPGGQPRSRRTDEDGRFSFTGLSLGTTEWWPALAGEEARDVEVVAPSTDVGDVVVRAHGRVSGRVVDGLRPHPPYSGVCRIELRDGRRRLAIAPGRIDGSFEFLAPLQPTAVAVFCWPATEPILSADVVPPATDLFLDVTGRLARVEFEPAGIPAGTPVQVGLSYLPEPGERIACTTYSTSPHGEGGPMRVVEWRGNRVAITALAPGRHVAWIDAASFGGGALPVFEVAAGQHLDLGTVELGWSAIDVAVVDGLGEPVSGLQITALGPGTSPRIESGTSDADGRWTIGRASPGPWSVYPTAAGTYGPSTSRVVAAAGERAVARIEIAGLGRIAGRVALDGAPLPGAAISLRADDDGIAFSGRTAQAAANDAGEYAFAAVPFGRYLVDVASPKSTVARSKLVEVADGAGGAVHFDLVGATTAVRFVERGEPVSRIFFASAWNARGLVSLEPTSAPGTFTMPRWSGPTLFDLSRTGVPGSRRVGDSDAQGFASSTAVAVLDPSLASIDVELPDSRKSMVLAPASVESVTAVIVGVRGFDELAPGAVRALLGVAPTPEGWTCHGLVPDLELEIREVVGGETRIRRWLVPR